MKYTCSMETVQQNGRFTLFSSKLHSNIYSILFDYNSSLFKSLFSIHILEYNLISLITWTYVKFKPSIQVIIRNHVHLSHLGVHVPFRGYNPKYKGFMFPSGVTILNTKDSCSLQGLQGFMFPSGVTILNTRVHVSFRDYNPKYKGSLQGLQS